jgi:hypothetical protein
MNRSERYVYSLARNSALSLWSYANPINGQTGTELCDVLVMFDQDIVVISVKEIDLAGNSDVDLQRWRRKAIDKSVKQIYGAERWLKSATHVMRSDGSSGLPLQSPGQMRIHRVAVALGSGGDAPIPSGDFGKGFVHVFDDFAFDIILRELDTAPDLFEYLHRKVNFFSSASHALIEGGEEDVLALYLANDRSFPSATGVVSIGQGLWDDFSSHPGYISKQEANEASSIWDGLIETVSNDALSGNLEFGGTLSDTERALRLMAAENRYHRRMLGNAYKDFLVQSDSIRSRLVISPSGTTYVFLATSLDTNRKDRAVELAARCFAARGRVKENAKVVGIATEQYKKDQGFSLDLFCMVKPHWTDDDQSKLDELLNISPYFSGELTWRQEDPEYPE